MTIGPLTLELLNFRTPRLPNSRTPDSLLLAKFPLARITSGC